MKILYLEDEAWQIEDTVVTFVEKELGHIVIVVRSAEEAKSELSRIPYDVVFLDIMMDSSRGQIDFDASGLQVAQWILEGQFGNAGNPPSLPIVIASGVWDATVKDVNGRGWTVEDRAHALGISQRSFLRKPFLVDEVREVLSQVLQRDPEE